jgi:hypothetical protein
VLLDGVREEKLAAAFAPLNGGEVMPDLEAVRAEFEAAEERGRAETTRDGERVGGFELETALGDEAGCVGLGGDVVLELDRGWPELGLNAEVWVPLHGRE